MHDVSKKDAMLHPGSRAIWPLPRTTANVTQPRRRASWLPRRRDGQSVVEFALIAPIMVILLLAIVDFARVYTTMMSVESAAREAADYATTLGAEKWQAPTPMDVTVAELRKRACVAASNLPDYADPETPNDPSAGNCTNPIVVFCMTAPPDTTCDAVDPLFGNGDSCEDPLREPPCKVTVTATYDFKLFAPVGIDFFGRRLGLPSSVTIVRDSTFAITDIDVAATPAP
jgi:hypothetical protein